MCLGRYYFRQKALQTSTRFDNEWYINLTMAEKKTQTNTLTNDIICAEMNESTCCLSILCGEN